MLITLTQKSLAAALDPVRRIVEKKGTIPILANVELRAAAEGPLDPAVLMLTGTDLDRELSITVPATVEVAGVTTVPAHLLYDIVRKLPAGGDVTLAVDGEGREMTVCSGRSKFRLQCLPESDFPDIRRSEPTHEFKVTGEQVRSMFGRTAFAMSREETRYYLNGVHLHVRDDVGLDCKFLTAVATCGHRLARIEIMAPEGSVGMPGIIVPFRAVEEIVKIVGKGDAEVRVRLSSESIEFTVGETTLFSKLIDGTFPDYRRVIPAQNPHSLTVDRKAFADAVQRVAVVSSERGRGVKLAISSSEIVLSVTAPDAGTAVETVDCAFDGEALEIGYNSSYLADILAGFEDDEVKLKLADPGSPTLFQADDDLMVVLMPMRV